MNSNNLFTRFIINSIVAFLITAALLSVFVTKNIINQEIEHNIEIVSMSFGHSLHHWFKSVDIQKLSDSDIEVLNEEFDSLKDLGNINRIRIWDYNGRMIYSSENLTLESIALNEAQLAELKSSTGHYTVLSKDSNDNETIKIYLAIEHDGSFQGVFEVDRSFNSSRLSINSNLSSVLIILFIGFFLLLIFLSSVIYRSSNKLIKQHHEIIQQNTAINDSYLKLNNLYHSMIKAITKAIDARDKFTSGHSQRVSEQSVAFAQFLGLEQSLINQLEIAALLHDIGKLGIPESILNKPGKLTSKEYDIIKNHPLIGEHIIEDINEFQEIISVVKYHHEQYAGGGYPEQLIGEDIPFMARIVTLTDAYDAMKNNRPYRKSFSESYIKNEIINNAGTQFDPKLATKFIEYLGI